MIEQILNIDNYATDTRKDRRKNNKEGKSTAEFFTPYSIVKKMCDKISDDDWKDSEKTFCEPCFGNGQFILYIIYKRLQANIDWRTILKTLYGVELMQDNVDETYERILDLFDKLNIKYDKDEALKIMHENLVCSDFFEWDFENWKHK